MSEKRQRTAKIMVRATPEELAAIRGLAAKHSLSVPAYLRTLGLGFTPKSTVDQQAITRLTTLHGDLGRVGGLLKIFIKDPLAAAFDFHQSPQELIAELDALQQEIKETIRAL